MAHVAGKVLNGYTDAELANYYRVQSNDEHVLRLAARLERRGYELSEPEELEEKIDHIHDVLNKSVISDKDKVAAIRKVIEA